jgi:eukaryotic-like serine/threonine-protein kinase
MNSIDARIAPGTVLAGYRLERLLGVGGLGSVYLAHDAAGEAVALKVMSFGGADGALLQRTFDREVAAARRLDHPDIVRVRAAGRSDDLGFVAMEYVDGPDLGRFRAAHQAVAAATAARLVARVARALAHAHAQGVLHRDIKAANILVDEARGEVKLGDFGLAQLADLQRSRTGVFAGTPAYMSPEQLAESGADERSDLYSLGVVLFELLAGRLPHEAASLGLLLREVARSPAPPLQRLQPDVPAALAALVASLLEKDRERRPRDAAAVAAALEAWQHEAGSQHG